MSTRAMDETDASGHPRQVPESIIAAAIRWSIRLDYNTASDSERQAFERWLAADPVHGLAWQRVHGLTGLRSDLGAMPPALARDTLHKARDRHVNRRQGLKLLTLVGLGIAGGWLARDHAPWAGLSASTGIGEQDTLHLEDGSVIVLNTDSGIRIDFAPEHRMIDLRRGEILIATGEDLPRRRPFRVRTPFGHMQALGTRFVVRLHDARAHVSVLEGAVRLHPADGAAPAIVAAGESRWLARDGTEPAPTSTLGSGEWARGYLAGSHIRLEELLQELARYRRGHIVCDPRVADLRVSGSFQLTDTDLTLQFLEQTLPVRVSYRTRFWVTVAPRH